MAQGTIKSRKTTTASSSSSSRKPSALGPKKGQRAIAPKKKKLVEQRKITKVCYFIFHILSAFFQGVGERDGMERKWQRETKGGREKVCYVGVVLTMAVVTGRDIPLG